MEENEYIHFMSYEIRDDCILFIRKQMKEKILENKKEIALIIVTLIIYITGWFMCPYVFFIGDSSVLYVKKTVVYIFMLLGTMALEDGKKS